MPVGEGFSAAQRTAIDAAVRRAETESRYEFSVFVGAAEQESRPFAERLHASLSAPARSVLVMVDPQARAVEVGQVGGSGAAHVRFPSVGAAVSVCPIATALVSR